MAETTKYLMIVEIIFDEKWEVEDLVTLGLLLDAAGDVTEVRNELCDRTLIVHVREGVHTTALAKLIVGSPLTTSLRFFLIEGEFYADLYDFATANEELKTAASP